MVGAVLHNKKELTFKVMNKTSQRQTGPELLRIVAMLLIVFHHFAVHSGIDYSTFSANNAFLTIAEFGGKIGVNIFVLITGYFSCTSKFTVKRIVKLIVATEFYSILLMVMSVIFQAQVLSKTLLIKGVFPLIFGDGYWFVSAYIILYALSPILNLAINKLSKNYMTFIILFLLSVYCILPKTIGVLKRVNDYGVSTVIWFVIIYLIGAYFRKYSFPIFEHIKIATISLIGLLSITFSAKVYLLYNGGVSSGIFGKLLGVLADSSLYSVMSLAISVLFFIVFSKINIKANTVVLSVAKSTFGIYLIHDNVLFRDFLWSNIIQTGKMYQYEWFALYAICAVVLLFIVCSVIDILYSKVIENNIFKLNFVDKIIKKIDRHIV